MKQKSIKFVISIHDYCMFVKRLLRKIERILEKSFFVKLKCKMQCQYRKELNVMGVICEEA